MPLQASKSPVHRTDMLIHIQSRGAQVDLDIGCKLQGANLKETARTS